MVLLVPTWAPLVPHQLTWRPSLLSSLPRVDPGLGRVRFELGRDLAVLAAEDVALRDVRLARMAGVVDLCQVRRRRQHPARDRPDGRQRREVGTEV